MHINTTRYIFAHSRKPRGYGLWFFKVTVNGVDRMVDYGGTYTNAVKSVWAYVKTLTSQPLLATVSLMP